MLAVLLAFDQFGVNQGAHHVPKRSREREHFKKTKNNTSDAAGNLVASIK